MRKNQLFKKGFAVGIILLFGVTSIIPSTAQETEKLLLTSSGHWLYVGGSGPGNYTRIQDAIDNASDGDIVFIYNGVYQPVSNIHVYKELTIIGESKDGVIVEHETGSEELSIRAKNVTVSSITFRNFRIENEDIFNHAVITNNIFIIDNDEPQWNPEVIYMAGENNEISDNTMIFMGAYTGNSNPTAGIFFQCYQSRIINNTITGVGSGPYEAILLLDRSYWVDDLVKGKNIIEGNTFSKTGCGINLEPTLRPGYNSRIIHNNFIDNTENARFAIHLPSVVDIIRNNIKRLKYFVSSPDNQNTFFSGLPLNYWDENYWSDYGGSGPKLIPGSLQSEGVVNQFFLYVIPWINVDRHPALEPYNISDGGNQEKYSLICSHDMTELAIKGLGPMIMWIKNVGNATALNVSWSITIKGRFIFLGRDSSGVLLGPLDPGQEITVGQKQLLLGFGSFEIPGTAWADNAPMVSAKLTGKIILFFIIRV